MTTQIPVLYACCIPVKGASRSIVCDLQRKSFLFIPNELYEILTDHKGHSIQEIKGIYENKYDETIEEYFEFLLSQEYIFITDEPEKFPTLSLVWKSPSPINHAIIDIGSSSAHNWDRIFSELSSLRCKHLQIRSFVKLSHEDLENILQKIRLYPFFSVEIVIPYARYLTETFLKDLIQQYVQIFLVKVHSSPKTWNMEGYPQRMGNYQYIKQKIDNESHCGFMHPHYFVINEESFL